MIISSENLAKLVHLHKRQNALLGELASLSDELAYIHEMNSWESEKIKRHDAYTLHFMVAAYTHAEKAEGNLGAVINILLG